MRTFRLLYFRESLLEQAEEVSAPSVVEAIGKAAGQPPDIRVEVWSESGRVGVIGPAHRK